MGREQKIDHVSFSESLFWVKRMYKDTKKKGCVINQQSNRNKIHSTYPSHDPT